MLRDTCDQRCNQYNTIPVSSNGETALLRFKKRPFFADSHRALIGISNEQCHRPSITADSNPVTEDPSGGTEGNDEEVEPQATSQRRVTKKVASKVHQVSKRTGKGIEVNLAQDSDDEHSQLAAKKDKTKDSNGFDHWVLYFHPPGQGPKQKPNSEAYACRWCPKESHRDRANYKSSQKKSCAGQAQAIKSGCNLPPTPAEVIAEKVKSGAAKPGTLIASTTRGKFDNTTMIKLLIIWLIRECLPWLRMEDFHLQLAFDHAIISSSLPSRVWAAAQAHRLYLKQRSQVIKLIKESNSKISLISDVWTTKGSHKAFVGITV
ncbi:hypothetical protein PSHT_11071 [Puccinia striiformis]|uniref:HAT C-terminal dimerisation domain-containing protein n=1 Tax=Puccinia striiformis TaxID=27350 RepID=A0A2S4V5W8_9BASI|nr:hypothetical protein PSHT_11071 [Puccinia striiformis]